ncbi:Dyp-type peroxidase [Pilatotrama ljubarskyi]|nr:Dyp-type peroxidase [Pilatotrama ljubarskyi]
MSSGTTPAFDPANVQGDILVGLPKKSQQYIIFRIDENVTAFRQNLAKLIPLITTTTQVMQDWAKIAANKKAAEEQGKTPELLKLSGVNIAFSHAGLLKASLGITDDIGDTAFKNGQFNDAPTLGDQGTNVNGKFVPDWIPAFKSTIHGVILISGDSDVTITATRLAIEAIFNFGAHNAALHEVITLKGTVRPGAEKGHEHFGWLDGISQPAVQGDSVTTRPSWALDGSFLALRYLFQLVPDFNFSFLESNPITSTGLSPAEGSELLGARPVGRWKSGAPVDITPLKDDPALGADPLRNNNFRYAFPDDPTTSDRCPFAAHTRKTNPRADLEDPPINASTESRRIIRRGVQFGPEVSPAEAAAGKTQHGRGLIFAAYQSNIVNGFQFIQHSWANNVNFPPKQPVPPSTAAVVPGFDPIIGQASDVASRTLIGTDPGNEDSSLSLPTQWVVPKGGEYFFSPSIPALGSVFAASA